MVFEGIFSVKGFEVNASFEGFYFFNNWIILIGSRNFK